MRLVYLKGSFELIENRLAQRQHHFMSKDLLRSQFDTLEEPKDAIGVDISEAPAVIVKQIRDKLGV
jgi:gluconokinase